MWAFPTVHCTMRPSVRGDDEAVREAHMFTLRCLTDLVFFCFFFISSDCSSVVGSAWDCVL